MSLSHWARRQKWLWKSDCSEAKRRKTTKVYSAIITGGAQWKTLRTHLLLEMAAYNAKTQKKGLEKSWQSNFAIAAVTPFGAPFCDHLFNHCQKSFMQRCLLLPGVPMREMRIFANRRRPCDWQGQNQHEWLGLYSQINNTSTFFLHQAKFRSVWIRLGNYDCPVKDTEL